MKVAKNGQLKLEHKKEKVEKEQKETSIIFCRESSIGVYQTTERYYKRRARRPLFYVLDYMTPIPQVVWSIEAHDFWFRHLPLRCSLSEYTEPEADYLKQQIKRELEWIAPPKCTTEQRRTKCLTRFIYETHTDRFDPRNELGFTLHLPEWHDPEAVQAIMEGTEIVQPFPHLEPVFPTTWETQAPTTSISETAITFSLRGLKTYHPDGYHLLMVYRHWHLPIGTLIWSKKDQLLLDGAWVGVQLNDIRPYVKYVGAMTYEDAFTFPHTFRVDVAYVVNPVSSEYALARIHQLARTVRYIKEPQKNPV
jgi:hypothetical protein